MEFKAEINTCGMQDMSFEKPTIKYQVTFFKIHTYCIYVSQLDLFRVLTLSPFVQSLVQTMLLSRTHREESQLAAKIEYECKMRGAQRMA
jgi:hypothetical protein